MPKARGAPRPKAPRESGSPDPQGPKGQALPRPTLPPVEEGAGKGLTSTGGKWVMGCADSGLGRASIQRACRLAGRAGAGPHRPAVGLPWAATCFINLPPRGRRGAAQGGAGHAPRCQYFHPPAPPLPSRRGARGAPPTPRALCHPAPHLAVAVRPARDQGGPRTAATGRCRHCAGRRAPSGTFLINPSSPKIQTHNRVSNDLKQN